MTRRGLWIVVVAALVALGAPQAHEARSGPDPTADPDGDGLFETLEARLIGKAEDAKVDVIVVLGAPASDERVRSLARGVGGFTVSRRFDLVHGFAATMRKEQIGRLASLAGVAHVEANATVHAAVDSAQASFGVAQARVDAGVDGNADGSVDTYSRNDFVAAVVDSGIDVSHADLDEGKVIGWTDLVNGVATPYDDLGHGTAVAAVLAGEGDARPDKRYRGVAPGAGLVGVKVLDDRGSGTIDDVVAGVEFAVDRKDEYGIEAVNLSLEQPGCSDGTDALSLAVNAAHDAGLSVVAAAGNQGPGTCTIGSPGSAVKALTVAAMSDLGEQGFAQARFSSRGRTLDGRIKPDVSAPGVSITTALAGTSAGYRLLNGTSLAAPFVTGLALLMRDGNPALGPQDVKNAIMSTAVDWGRSGDNTTVGSSGPDIDYGAGRLDGYAAIEAAVGWSIGLPPPMPSHELLEGSLSGTGAQVDHVLNVTDATFPIAATLILPSIAGGSASTPDFDLYLIDPNGNTVVSATTSMREDTLGYMPVVAGTYLLRVRSQSGGGGYFLDVSAGQPPTPPANVEPPAILGVAEESLTLTATNGAWTGTRPLSFARRWQRCDASGAVCNDVLGAVGSAYALTSSDVARTLRVVVTASNAAGSSSAASPASGVVTARPVAPASPPGPAGRVPPPSVSAARVRISRGHRVLIRVRIADCQLCNATLRMVARRNRYSVKMTAAGPDVVGVLRYVPSGRWQYAIDLEDRSRGIASRTTRRLAVPRLRLRATVRQRKVVIVLRGAGCMRCEAALWARVRGTWRSAPLGRSGDDLRGTLGNVPRGRWPFYASVRYAGGGLEVTSEWQLVRA